MIQNEEFINEFVEEAQSHLEMIEAGLLKMEEGSGDLENVNSIFRSIHSIKGTAGFFGLEKIVALAHVMENLLGEIRNEKITADSIMIDKLLGGNDQLKSMVQDVYNSESVDVSDFVAVFTLMLEQDDYSESDSKGSIFKKESQIAVKSDDSKMKEQIREARKHGHYLYKVTIGINQGLEEEDISPVKFFKKIQTVGEIVDSFIDISEVDGLNDSTQADAYFTFVFTTVLEKTLLPIALDLHEENFVALNTLEELKKPVQQKKNSRKALSYEAAVSLKGSEEPDQERDIPDEEPSTENKVREEKVLPKKEAASQGEDSVRVHVSLLNDLLTLASEMVLGRNQLLRNIEVHRKEVQGLDAILQNIDRVTTELQEKIMQTRMQPVGNVFNKMPRIIRDLSKKMGKEVDLEIEGSHVELDKSIIESLSDPLTHLIRNAVDHGLEKPDLRKARGKSTVGKVLLKAYHQGGYVLIDIVDDGAGIDVQKIRNTGLEKNLVTEHELSQMSEQDILQLLMKPGFSTAEQVTDVSGRGVGMDVVKTNIEKLGGTIIIKTKPGTGTTFRLILPLTLAIIPSLIVEVEEYKFAIPQVNLQEMVRIKAGDESKKIEFVHNAQVLRLRGNLLPIVYLSDVLGLPGQKPDKSDTPVPITRILVLKAGTKRFGLVVDRIHDEEEILVKPLPRHFKNCQCYSGVTIMGDGRTAMILDPEGIVTKTSLRFSDEQAEISRRDQLKKSDELKELQNLLMFKCSGAETFAIDLSLVSRVEEIDPSHIELIGDKEYIQYRGEALRVIRPEDYLPVTRRKNEPKKLFVIIPKLISNPIGLVIEKIYDTMLTTIKLNQEEIKGKGLIGSTILEDRIVLLINLFEIFEMVSPDEYEDNSLRSRNGEYRILLVEDTPFFARMMKYYLEWGGYQVIMAENGQEALDILKKCAVDLVLSDIQMPVMDGLELARHIRKNPDLASLPLVALTSMTSEGDRQAGMEAGFDFYEIKLDKVTLLKALKNALELRRDVV